MYKFYQFCNHLYMSKFKIINLFDKLFISISIFLIIYAWINFYVRNLWTTFFLSLIFSAACVFVLYYFLNKKQEKVELGKKNTDEMNKSFLVFRLTPRKQKMELLYNLLSKEFNTKLGNGILTYIKDEKKHLVIVATHIERISENDLINLVDEFLDIDVDVIDIICNDVNPNINSKIFVDKKITFITKQKLYLDYFSKYQIFPDNSKIDTSITKLRFKDILNNMFIPQKAKSYFFCGLILIFSSIILPYHIYYIVFGSLLLIFSILCKILPKLKKNK